MNTPGFWELALLLTADENYDLLGPIEEDSTNT
jgi:hypothetical protein